MVLLVFLPVKRADTTAYNDVARSALDIVVARRGRRSMRLKGELFIVELIGDLTYYYRSAAVAVCTPSQRCRRPAATGRMYV